MSKLLDTTDSLPSWTVFMGLGWREVWIRHRNRWLADPAFQSFAFRFAPFRPVARHRAGSLFALVTGFTFSQLIAAGVKLNIFQMLQQAPHSAEEISRAVDLPVDAAQDLLEGLAAISMTERLPDGRFMLGIHGAAFVADPGIAAMVRHNQLFYADLADPVALLRQRGGGQVSGYWPYAEGGEGSVAPYSELMAASQPAVAQAVLDASDFEGVSRLMDVGGGEGAFLAAVHHRHPGIGLMLFDLPDVASRAAARLGPSAQVFSGDFPTAPLPSGADCISFVRVLHDHDDDAVLSMLRRAHEALPKGGRILIAEPMAGRHGAAALGDVYFRLYMRAMGRGRPRSPAEIKDMLRAIGFADVRQHRTPNPYAAQVVSGRRAEESLRAEESVKSD